MIVCTTYDFQADHSKDLYEILYDEYGAILW